MVTPIRYDNRLAVVNIAKHTNIRTYIKLINFYMRYEKL